MAATENKGKIVFAKEDAHWGYVKGACKWAKVLKPDEYGNYSIDIYPSPEDMAHFKEVMQGVADTAYDGVVALGKKPMKQTDFVKEDKEGKEMIKFKLEAENTYSNEANHITIYDVYGKEVKDWDKLVGNGSIVKIKYRAKPYFMASSKVAGVSTRFFAIQIINLSEYSGGTQSGFGDETSGDAPFDSTSNEEF